MTNGLPYSILVVEDDADDRIFLDDAFLQIGFDAEVKKFKDAKGLFYYLESIEKPLYPSLIVLDNTLRETNAAGVIAHLKGNDAYQGIRVVVYSGALSAARQKELRTLGVDAFYEKATSMEEITRLAKELKTIAEGKPLNPQSS